MNPKVDTFLERATRWREEMDALRAIALDCGLDEELKWGKPCYMFQNGNVAIIQPFKEQCGFMFFKGALLKDPDGLLEAPGQHSQAARRLMFSSVEDVRQHKSKLRAFIAEAIKLETAGAKVPVKKAREPLPAELEELFGHVAGLKAAFDGLTPGRQRAYIIHFSRAKQSKARRSRIEKWVPKILDGKGMND